MQYEGRHPGEFVMTEANGQRSREAVTIATEQTIVANSILAKRLVLSGVTTTAAADAENAGDAIIALGEPAATTKVRDGRYSGVAIDATHVRWEDPAGVFVGTSIHDTPFAGEISFTIAAGGTPTEANDGFYVDVSADTEDFQHVSFDPAGDDPIAGIAIYPATTGVGETVKVAAIVRDAEANGNCVAWPAGITDAQRTLAEGALRDLGIIVRN